MPSGPFRTTSALAEDGPLMDLMFRAVAEATEEAVLGSLFAAHPVTGIRGHHAPVLPTDRVTQLLRQPEPLAHQGAPPEPTP